MAPLQEIDLELFADYFQFYLLDEGSELAQPEWTSEELAALLVASEGELIVGTARNMTVPVKVAVFRTEPVPSTTPRQLSKLNESQLLVRSGIMLVAGSSDYLPEAARLVVEPGLYQAKIYYYNLETISADGLSGDDAYTVHLWPAAGQETAASCILEF